MTKLFMLDNLDSFTYNLVDEFHCLGFEPIVYRNTLSAQFIFKKMADYTAATGEAVMLVLSPGPGEPKNAGCLMELIKLCAGNIPMLGICLGHQALIEHYGGKVGRANEIVHGKASAIVHDSSRAFASMPNPLPVARYHSLVGIEMPESLSVIASFNELPMAICQEKDAVLAFQFHPESILTTHGTKLLSQSIEQLFLMANGLNTEKVNMKHQGVQHEH